MHCRLLLGEHCTDSFAAAVVIQQREIGYVIHSLVHVHVVNRGHWHILDHSFVRSVCGKD